MRRMPRYALISVTLILLLVALVGLTPLNAQQDTTTPLPSAQPTMTEGSPEPTPQLPPIGGRCISPIFPDLSPALCDPGDGKIGVCAPDAGGIAGEQVERPIWIAGLTVDREEPISEWNFTLSFDSRVLRFVAVSQENTLSEDWIVDAFPIGTGKILVEATSSVPITTSGKLIMVTFEVVGSTGMHSDLIFNEVHVNDGTPTAISQDGSFQVVTTTVRNNCVCYLPLVGH